MSCKRLRNTHHSLSWSQSERHRHCFDFAWRHHSFPSSISIANLHNDEISQPHKRGQLVPRDASYWAGSFKFHVETASYAHNLRHSSNSFCVSS